MSKLNQRHIKGLLEKSTVTRVFNMKDRNGASETRRGLHRSSPSYRVRAREPRAGEPDDLFGSLEDYTIISQNVALKAVTLQKIGDKLINLND